MLIAGLSGESGGGDKVLSLLSGFKGLLLSVGGGDCDGVLTLERERDKERDRVSGG
jgi:hypothetical protein